AILAAEERDIQIFVRLRSNSAGDQHHLRPDPDEHGRRECNACRTPCTESSEELENLLTGREARANYRADIRKRNLHRLHRSHSRNLHFVIARGTDPYDHKYAMEGTGMTGEGS